MTSQTLAQAQSVMPEPADKPLVEPVRRKRPVLTAICAAWLGAVVLAAALYTLFPLSSDTIIAQPRTPPAFDRFELWFGTDDFGRSIMARVILGARASLLVGVVAGLGGFLIGSALGLLSGFARGWVDSVCMLLSDAVLAFPPLILLLALASVLQPSLTTLLSGLTLLTVPTFLRLVRANTLSVASHEFVLAARNMGATNSRILFREIAPSVLPRLATYLPVVIAALIVAEGSLSFLGLGIPPPAPSWGGMIASGKASMVDAPHLIYIPALIIFFTVFALNQVGDYLRDRFDGVDNH
ncbi:ABC transporter permease [Streptomyces sp. NPDC055681]